MDISVITTILNEVNQLIEVKSAQQETLVYIISILNITGNAARVNKHSNNVIMDKIDDTVQDINNLYNLITTLVTSLSYHQLILHIRNVWCTSAHCPRYIGSYQTPTGPG